MPLFGFRVRPSLYEQKHSRGNLGSPQLQTARSRASFTAAHLTMKPKWCDKCGVREAICDADCAELDCPGTLLCNKYAASPPSTAADLAPIRPAEPAELV